MTQLPLLILIGHQMRMIEHWVKISIFWGEIDKKVYAKY